MTSWLLFALSVYGMALTLNAWRPLRWEVLSPFTFFNGWLISEMPVQTVVGQAAVTAVLIATGALDHTAGRVGLGVAAASWILVLGLAGRARQAGPVLTAALDEALPTDWRAAVPARPTVRSRWRQRAQLVVPFWMRDHRVEVVRNLDYWGDGRHAHRLDIYRPRTEFARTPEFAPPAESGRGRPVLVYIHGGGWVIGDKREQGKPMMLYLAALGWVCVTVNYRLSPRATWPDHLVDCKRAVAWVRDHIAEYGGDPSFVAVSGSSAGGHLAALVALTSGEDRYQPGFEDRNTSVDACVPFYGVYDFANRDGLRGFGFGRFIERMVLKRSMADAPDLYRDTSPLDQVGPDGPPFMIVHGSNDTLVPVKEARSFAALLRAKSGQPVAYAELPGAQHAFEVFRSIRTALTVRAIADFLEYVRGMRSPATASTLAVPASAASTPTVSSSAVDAVP